MDEPRRKWIFIIILICILLYFSMQEKGASTSVLSSAEQIAYKLGAMLGNFASGAVAVLLYALIRKWILKIKFPVNFELLGLIIYTTIIITAVRQMPK
ncbi:MAG: hypothetical protein V1933_01780 [Candidatus Omnitrophota bacterium]